MGWFEGSELRWRHRPLVWDGIGCVGGRLLVNHHKDADVEICDIIYLILVIPDCIGQIVYDYILSVIG